MFRYHPSDIVAINTKRYNCVHQTKNTLVIRPEDDPEAPTEAFSNTAIDALRKSNQWRYYLSLEAQNRLLRRTQEQGFALSSASKKDREKAIFVFMEVMAVKQLHDEGKIVLTPNSLEENWHKFTSILNNREIARRLCGRALRAGERLPLRKPHRPATLPEGRRWVYVALDRATRVIVGLRIADTSANWPRSFPHRSKRAKPDQKGARATFKAPLSAPAIRCFSTESADSGHSLRVQTKRLPTIVGRIGDVLF